MNIINKPIFEIESHVDDFQSEGLPLLNITVLRNITLEPITPYIRYLGLCMGYKVNLVFGDYDNVMQDILLSDSLLRDNTDCTMVFLKLETLSPGLIYRFAELSSRELQYEVELVQNFIDTALKGIRAKTNALICWHGFELPIYPAFGMQDFGSESMQVGIVEDLNRFLKRQLSLYNSCFYIDLNNIRSAIGHDNFHDNRYWNIAKAPYTLTALKNIAIDNFKLIRALKGKSKKCLVLDCDNTLWGGVVGEDNLNGIKLGPEHPGSTFYEFQQEILSLYHRGIIITLCSKNNEDDVWAVFDQHPHMLLKREHISAYQINWDDKAKNIQNIASTLNIGLDSVVFIDDSEFEINLINNTLPEVETIQLKKERSFAYRATLASCGFFDTLSYTDEDRMRGRQYGAEVERKNSEGSFDGNIEFYLKSLDMEANIAFANSSTVKRVAQLTQKTNQFNLTTKRYSESDIEMFCASEEFVVLTVRLKDRFGDLGIVGCTIISLQDEAAYFDSFLLSCRAIGRGLDAVFLHSSLEVLKDLNINKFQSSFFPTLKNMQVEEFYPSFGFKLATNNKDVRHYIADTSILGKNKPSYFKKITINS